MNHILRLILLTFFISIKTFSQYPGSIDTNFNPNGISINNTIYNSETIKAYHVLQNGKILIGGNLQEFHGETVKGLALLNSDCSLDNSFTPNINGSVNHIEIQNDNKIIIVGDFTECNNIYRNNIARLNSDGTIDQTFNPGNGIQGTIHDVKIQNDNKILICGTNISYNNTPINKIFRIDTNGYKDNTFNYTENLYSDNIFNIDFFSDNKILFCTANENNSGKFYKLNTDGTINTSFEFIDPNYNLSFKIASFFIDNNDNIILGGNALNYYENGDIKKIIKLDSNGIFINSININSSDVNNTISNNPFFLYELNDNNILLACIDNSHNKSVKITNTGTVIHFYENNYLLYPKKVFTQNNGKIYTINDTNGYPTSKSIIKRFNEDGTFDINFNPFNGTYNCRILKTIKTLNNKYLILADYDINNNKITYNDKFIKNKIFQINSDGSLDESFQLNITQDINGYETYIYDIAIQSDGKIICLIENSSGNKTIRLNNNGNQDLTFNECTFQNLNSTIFQILIQNDDKIIIAKTPCLVNGIQKNGIIRLNSNGILDNTFQDQSFTYNYSYNFYRIFLQPDQKIILFGEFKGISGIQRYGMARLETNGSLDLNFSTGTAFAPMLPNSDEITILHSNTDIEFLSDGKILIGGHFAHNSTFKKLIRLNYNGSLDNTFNGINNIPREVCQIEIDNNNKIIYYSYGYNNSNQYYSKLGRLNYDGSEDTTFNSGTDFYYSSKPTSLLITSDNFILCSGFGLHYDGYNTNDIVRINNGIAIAQPTPIINTNNLNANSYIKTLNILNDDSIYIAGNFNSYNNINRNKISKLLPSGNNDTNFTPAGGFDSNATITCSALYPNGKIIIGGLFTTYNGISIKNLVRINSDGTLDTTFNPNLSTNNIISEIALQNDGKIILTGNFTTYNNTQNNYLVRLNPDGSIDTSFNIGLGFDNISNCIAIQNDGKIIIGGNFTSYNNIFKKYLIRLNIDGTIDHSFNYIINKIPRSIRILNNNKILIGGYNHLNRILENGSIDNYFNCKSVSGTISSIEVFNNNKILIGGQIESIQYHYRLGLACLNENGLLDLNFNINNIGPNNQVNKIAIKSNNNIVIAGNFTKFNGYTANYITEIENNNLNFENDIISLNELFIYPNPVKNNLYINYEYEILEIEIFNLFGKLILKTKNKNQVDLSNLNNGLYILKIHTKNGTLIKKIIKE